MFGGTSINTQTEMVAEGSDVIVATPGRLYDMALSRGLTITHVKKLVIDEVDVMLDLGFRHQLTNIFELNAVCANILNRSCTNITRNICKIFRAI